MRGTIFDLTGKKALITGGSKGIGRAIAEGFAAAGADLFLCARSEGPLKAAAEEIAARHGVEVHWTTADMVDRAEANRVAKEAVERLGRVDILVNNAGHNIPQPIDQIADEAWDRIVDLNLNGVMALTRAITPGMIERGWGRVIHISSIMGLASTPARNAYSATKAALIGMVKATALDLGPHGNLTANCIAPGPIATDMPMSILTPEQQDAISGRSALGRWGRPEELAGPVLLLASEAGSYISGECLVVDGGVLSRIF